MYYEKNQVKVYYRSYKGDKKPVKKINLSIKSKFEDGDDIIILSEDDFNKLNKPEDTGDNGAEVDVDINELIETNKNLQDKITNIEEIPQIFKLTEEINQLHKEHKKELLDKDEELKKQIKLSNLYLIVINELISRGWWSRMLNKKPKSYYHAISEEEILQIDSDNSDSSN